MDEVDDDEMVGWRRFVVLAVVVVVAAGVVVFVESLDAVVGGVGVGVDESMCE